MSLEPVEFISPLASFEKLVSAEVGQLPQTQYTQHASFADWMNGELTSLNDQILSSEVELRKLATGETSNLHHVMMELEKSKTSFQLTLQIRNKLLEGYRELMKMQI